MPVSSFSLDQQTRDLKGRIRERVGHMIDANAFANGPAVAHYEEDPANYLGSGTVVLCGVTIGRNSMIGAGAVVTEDVPEDVVVAGVLFCVMARGAASR